MSAAATPQHAVTGPAGGRLAGLGRRRSMIAVLAAAGTFGLLAPAGVVRQIAPLATWLGSADGHLEPAGLASLGVFVMGASAVAIAVAAALWLLGEAPIAGLVSDDGDRRGHRRLTLSAGLVALVTAIHAVGRDRPGYFGEVGAIELAQVLLLVVAARWVLAPGERRTGGWPMPRAVRRLAAVGCLLWIGEEISWGQALLGWQTPASWARHNLQGETNLHNLFNPRFARAYTAVAWGLVALAGAGLLARATRITTNRRQWRCAAPARGLEPFPLPSPHRLPLALALPVVDLLARATRRGHVYELLELLVALLVVAWASDLRRC